MKTTMIFVLTLFMLGLSACAHTSGGTKDVPSLAQAPEAVAALQASRFDDAAKMAGELLAQEDHNAQAHMVAALTTYKKAMHQLAGDLIGIGASAFVQGVNHRYLEFSLRQADEEMAKVEVHLAAAARDPELSLELCLADLRVDWNRTGRIDERDMRLLQLEVDGEGKTMPRDDPRRKPTFRFDRGDVFWARAMISFQRAALNVGLAYRMPEIQGLLRGGPDRDKALTFKMVKPEAVDRARGLILVGLEHSDRSRLEYLAEKDDDREWLPNPTQKDHPLPLPVDAQLYETWKNVLSDLVALVRGKEGIGVVEAAQLGDHKWEDPPRGYIDIGGLLSKPGDIVLRPRNLERLDHQRTRTDVEAVLSDLFGDKFKTAMKPSKLLSRLSRMKSEIQRGEDSLERKLRYLLWVN